MLYFTFRGLDSRDYGVYMTEPLEPISAEQGMIFDDDVLERDGSAETETGGHRDIVTSLNCYVKGGHISNAFALLRGKGKLIQSAYPDRAVICRINEEIAAQRLSRGLAERVIQIPVRLKPYRYFYPEPQDIEVTTSGTQITNPGTAPSAPRVEIRGSGDFSVTIGTGADASTVYFTDVTDGIIVDSDPDHMDAFTLDGAELANDHVSSYELFSIPPGNSTVSWTIESGSVSKVIITPRWRDY